MYLPARSLIYWLKLNSTVNSSKRGVVGDTSQVLMEDEFIAEAILISVTESNINSSCPRNLRHFGNGQKKCAHIFQVPITFLELY